MVNVRLDAETSCTPKSPITGRKDKHECKGNKVLIFISHTKRKLAKGMKTKKHVFVNKYCINENRNKIFPNGMLHWKS